MRGQGLARAGPLGGGQWLRRGAGRGAGAESWGGEVSRVRRPSCAEVPWWTHAAARCGQEGGQAPAHFLGAVGSLLPELSAPKTRPAAKVPVRLHPSAAAFPPFLQYAPGSLRSYGTRDS